MKRAAGLTALTLLTALGMFLGMLAASGDVGAWNTGTTSSTGCDKCHPTTVTVTTVAPPVTIRTPPTTVTERVYVEKDPPPPVTVVETVVTPPVTETVTETVEKPVTKTVTKVKTVVRFKTRFRTKVVYRNRQCTCPPGTRLWHGRCHPKVPGKG